MTAYVRYDPRDVHYWLYAATADGRAGDDQVADDGHVAAQAMFCPYYVPLEGVLGADWGVIVNPESAKFGRLVFEHEWCGCQVRLHEHGEWLAVHGSGTQSGRDWELPRSKRRKPFLKRGGKLVAAPVTPRPAVLPTFEVNG